MVEVGYLQVGRSARSVTGMEMEMQQPSLGPLGGGQRPLHHAPDTWERAKGGRDAVGRDSLGGFWDVPSPVRSTGFPWPLPMMRIGGGLEGEKVQLESSTMARGHAVRSRFAGDGSPMPGSQSFFQQWPRNRLASGGRFGARRVVNGRASRSG